MSKLAVIALGGNSLLLAEQKGTISEQETNVYNTCLNIFELIKQDYNLVITHGNGPQVGNIFLQNIAGNKMFGLPEMPLDICGAYSQGFIGYMIEQQLRNVLEKHDIDRDVITIITQVLVDKNDTAFQNPTKPIGPYYTKAEINKTETDTTSVFKEDAKGRGWRRVVASPKPLLVGNRNTIEKIARGGQIVIAVGGGGIPVFYVEHNKLQGIDAVIDKDIASALLASQIHADEFYILTDIAKVCINFNKPDEKKLDTLTLQEAKKYLEEEHFAEGSMAPKIRAAIMFTENSGKETIIAPASQLSKPYCGTKIVSSTDY